MSGARTGLQRRDQRVVSELVATLDQQAPERHKEARARARSLPTMLRRHGPIPVLLFLESKEGIDLELARWLIRGMAAVLPEVAETPERYAERLATLPLESYLLHWQTGVETAAWLKRLIEARTESSEPMEGDGSA